MKIKKITINSFRGIPNELTLCLTDRNGKPNSILLFGDNGSGKSSIIDAIEFNLQGKIQRSDSLKNEFRPSPLSWNNGVSKGASTTVYFENDTINKRSINSYYDKEKGKLILQKSSDKLQTGFQIASIVLRRNDIIEFLSTPVQRNQVIFWSFLYNTNISNESIIDYPDKVYLQNLDEERISLKTTRRELQLNLARILNIDEKEIPFQNRSEFDYFVKHKIRKGLSNKEYYQYISKYSKTNINIEALKISEEIQRIRELINEKQSQIAKLKKIQSPTNSNKKGFIEELLKNASILLTQAFTQISTIDFIEEISVSIGELTNVSFDMRIRLKNGKQVTPNSIFSEANLDLLILLLYTSLIKESGNFGQSKLIILDDVLQSVDSTIRLNFLDYLLHEFKDWQIIITAHDRLWLNQVRSAFCRHQHKFKEIEIFRWDFDSGPLISSQDNIDEHIPILTAINTQNTQIIASQSGLFLETICQKLSMELNTSIQRKKDDKYTIGDLWPGIKKHFKKTKLQILTEEIDRLLYIRNLLGAHYNEWAISLSTTEILNFADLLYKFYQKTFCSVCQGWINKTNSCNCGNIKIE